MGSKPFANRALRLGVGLAVTSVVCVSAVLSAGPDPTPEGFERLARSRSGSVVAVAPRSVDDLPAADVLRAGWQAFRRRHPGAWKVYLDERSALPTLVSGAGIRVAAPADSSPTDLEQHLRAFVDANRDLLDPWGGTMALDEDASAELRPGHRQLVFRQSVDGVLVENSRFDFHVVDGKLTLFGASRWGAPTVGGVPAIAADEAADLLDAYLRGASASLEPVGEPRLVLLARDADPTVERSPKRWVGARGAGLSHTLVWRLRYREARGPESWIAEVDAHDGRVLAFFDDTRHHAVRGGVLPESPDEGCTSGGCEIAGFPMPFADWTEDGQATESADAFGNLACVDPQATFETALSGPYFEVDDDCGPVLASGGCADGIDLGLRAGENCEVAPGSSPGNTVAARSAYYHANRVAEVARFYNPGNAYLNEPVRINTNWNQHCNASYGNGGIYLYRAGTSWAECANSGEIQGIIVHEWGHGYDENDGGGWDRTSEAYGDIVAMLASRQSCFGPGLFLDGRTCSGSGDACLTCTGFRDHDWAARQANTPATPQVFVQNNCLPGTGDSPCGGQVHCESYPIDESIFDLATRDLPASGMDADSAWQLVERLWYTTRAGSGGDIYNCALPSSDSCGAGSWYQRMRVADDDDADLSNGTPHAAALYAAFARHNIACGLPGDPENQSTSSCPALTQPALTVDETGATPQLGWSPVANAAEYLVLRGDLGCDKQQVPVEVLPAPTTTWDDTLPDPGVARAYRVQAIGSNAACRSAVSNCELAGGGPRLQLNAYSVLEEGNNINGNGVADPGETVRIPATLFNGGSADAESVSGRLRTVDPAQGRVVEPVAPYPDLAVGEAADSSQPHFELTLFESGPSCGDRVELELDMEADGASTRRSRIELQLGSFEGEFVKVDGQTIPIVTQQPVLSTLEVLEAHLIDDLDITVEIGHSYVHELTVDLTSPQNTTVRLHANSSGGPGPSTRYDLFAQPDGPGSMADFNGESTLGTWTLSVEDNGFSGPNTGTLHGFTLHVSSPDAFGCTVSPCPEPTPTEAPQGLLVDKLHGGGGIDIVFDWSPVGAAAGYHVLGAPGPEFQSAVDLVGRTDGATTLTVGQAAGPQVTFYQVRAVNGCSQESP
ncbi:MAG: hypothetical protein GY716_04140 [bacterium]|nr:hypothetical protein [bacterium]